MAISKVTLNGSTLIDVTSNTANKDNTLTGYTGTKNDGTTFTGEYTAPTVQTTKSYTVDGSGTIQIDPDTGYDAMSKVSLSVAGASFPTSPSSSSSGTLRATITPTTTNQYINITKGWNTANRYYAVEGDSDLIAGNIKSGVTIFNILGTYAGGGTGGGSGLTYETGTWTPTSDIAKGSISFSNTHTTLPMIVLLTDATGTSHTVTYSNYSFVYVDTYQLSSGKGIPYSSSAYRYGFAAYVYRTNSTTTTSTTVTQFQYNSDNTNDITASYPRYFVSTTAFYPNTNNSSRYWRNNRTYQWIAVWKPTT